MEFKELKQEILKQIEESEIDIKMISWVKKFNALENVCTVWCCQGHTREETSKKEVKEIENFKGVEEFGGYSPYISFVLNSDRIESSVFIFTRVSIDETEDFQLNIRKCYYDDSTIEYDFYFPYDFRKKLEEVYMFCQIWDDLKKMENCMTKRFLS